MEERLLLRVLLLVSLMVVGLSAGQAAAATLTITEEWNVTEVYFTVTNDGYTDIWEFAIGNNGAADAWVNGSASNPPSSLTEGFVAIKKKGHWVTSNYAEDRSLAWLDNALGFDSYTSAFLYTSWGYWDDGYNGYLDTGFTNGYRGTT